MTPKFPKQASRDFSVFNFVSVFVALKAYSFQNLITKQRLFTCIENFISKN